MNKFYSIAALGLFMAVSASAQTETTPNRMIVSSQVGDKAYAIDRVNNISFATKEGTVRADVKFLGYSKDEEGNDQVTVAVTRSDPDSQFSIAILPTNTAKHYDDVTMARYFEMKNSTKYSQDFTSGVMTGFDPLSANTSYTVVTLAYDEYGVACESSRAEFTTPKEKTVGTPSVTYTIDKLTSSSIDLTVTPNDDCKTFYWCQFEKGGAEKQFEQWGPKFGYANVEDMIKGFSQIGYSAKTSNTWSDLAPGTDYEIDILPTDVNGTYGDLVRVYFTTDKVGGDGLALCNITVGEFGQQSGQCYQYVTYTPNDQTAMFRDAIFVKNDKYSDDTAVNYLKTEYPFEVSGWNHYSEDVAIWNVEPSTDYVAVALAKNANGEWGTLVTKDFSTPASPANVAPAKVKATKETNGTVMQRINTVSRMNRTGVVPMHKGGLQLVEK